MSAPRQNSLRWLPGALISLALVALILWFIDFSEVSAAIQKADGRFLLVAAGVSLLWLSVRAQVWRTLLKNQARYTDVFFSMCEGYLLNNTLPFRLGEIGRAFLLSRKSKLGFVEILPTIIVERAFDLGYSAALLLATIPFILGTSSAKSTAYLAGGLVALGLAFLFILARKQTWALNIFQRLSQRWPVLQKRGGDLLNSLFAGLSVLSSPKLFAQFLFWMSLNWAIAIFQYFLIISAFFPHATPLWSMFGLGAAALGGAIPSLPGGIGTLEGAFGGALTLLSADQSTALAVALTVRLFNYFSSGFFGIFALSREGQTLAGVYRQLTGLKSAETPAQE